MAADRSAAELERFLAERADHLLRTAVLLTGSKEAGEDLLQTAVERLLRRWRRFDGDPEGYLRRTLCNLATDGYRERAGGGRRNGCCDQGCRRRRTLPATLTCATP
jgi:DNA-directed RNA polymerase specialized sigma24 family protein